MTSPPTPFDLAREAFLAACRLDVETPKPGNVSVESAGHGMTAAQFLASAQAAAGPLFAHGAPVGKRILDAVARTREVAGCNTNLGIVLLVAPLATSLDELKEHIGEALTAQRWRAATERVLARLTVDDARDAYRAIALANPGGLGDAPEQSVHDAPTVDLRAAMQLAAQRDSIARQYANGFADIFETGLAAVDEMPAEAPRLVTLNVFLTFLASHPDSHIVRKHGMALAQSVTLAARAQHGRWRAAATQTPDQSALRDLYAWDTELKSRGINPGTSADLTVATLFVAGRLAPQGWVRAPAARGDET
ncbi:triphosphoribosyl-dephospho-CoA synthase [Paraburkholderia kururiensis]|uniref:triphosphoribosyl-dephospho-CoA synthase n=1 Tax=Paraburkholderia kururiensis TaxID=984307 RepID=UPI0018F73E63|nr:triphosphoribosyl-dephospho-CoA synthase [Paraburkholderia kururiensis]